MTEQEFIRAMAKADMQARDITNTVFSIELLSNRPTHFDRDKGVKVKVFSKTIAGEICSADIMEGAHAGKGTTCFLKNLTRITATILLIMVFAPAIGQVKFDQVWFAKDATYHESIYLKADTMTVGQAFDHLKLLVSGPLWYMNRYVIKNDTVYLRYGITLRPNRTYIVKKNRRKHIKL